MPTRRSDIRRFLIDHIGDDLPNVTGAAANAFGVTRQAISGHLKRLAAAGDVVASGAGPARRYSMVRHAERYVALDLRGSPAESEIWREHVAPVAQDLPGNVQEMLAYATTEIVNNAIDHSQSDLGSVLAFRTAGSVHVTVTDQGEGIFRRIQRALGLSNPRDAVLALSMGKLTTDPARHSGEGIYFSSRTCDQFVILSGALSLFCRADVRGWLIDSTFTEEEDRETPGTFVSFRIAIDSPRRLQGVFDQYSAGADEAGGFISTQLVVKLAADVGGFLVSRSQAKRLLSRVDRFRTVVLDFSGVPRIGQAFADEVFRVFSTAHPEIRLQPVGASPEVEKMIAHVRAG